MHKAFDPGVLNSSVAVTVPRKGWEEAFAEMHENGDDRLLIDSFFEDEKFED